MAAVIGGKRYSSTTGRRLDGSQLRSSDRFHTRCLLKPSIILSIGRALEEHVGLSVDTQLADLGIARGAPAGELTLRKLIAHDHGFREPDAITWGMMAAPQRAAVLEAAMRGVLTQSTEPGYSEIVGWIYMELVLESLASDLRNVAPTHWVASEVEIDSTKGAVEPPWLEEGPRWIPLLSEARWSWPGRRPCDGFRASANEVAGFYAAWARSLHEETPGFPRPSTMRRLLECRAKPRRDPTTRRWQQFAGGLMWNPIGASSSSGYADFRGHTANAPVSAAAFDPSTGNAYAFVVAAIVFCQESLLDLVRDGLRRATLLAV